MQGLVTKTVVRNDLVVQKETNLKHFKDVSDLI